jgi:hypothetical protein
MGRYYVYSGVEQRIEEYSQVLETHGENYSLFFALEE